VENAQLDQAPALMFYRVCVTPGISDPDTPIRQHLVPDVLLVLVGNTKIKLIKHLVKRVRLVNTP
jgi:hypothetical protein